MPIRLRVAAPCGAFAWHLGYTSFTRWFALA